MKDLLLHNRQISIRSLLIIPLFLLCTSVSSQSLSVESFRLLENDLAANTRGTMKYDQNGDVAALIKVVTTETDFNFDVGSIGVVGTSQQKGEIWVYVPGGAQRITISHSNLGVLRDYYFPIPVESARTYEMKLVSGTVRTIVSDEATAQYVTFLIEPKTAVVFIDGQAYPTQSDGTVSELLAFGRHEYRVESRGYHPESGVIEVGKEKTQKQVTLKSSKAKVSIECQTNDADIYINNEKVGTGSWTGELLAAVYNVESRKAGHQSRLMTITLNESEERTLTLPAPQPLYGQLQIKSEPNIATVYIDGTEIGETPLLMDNVLTGEHIIELHLKNYNIYKTTITIEEGKVATIDAKMSNSFKASINSEPQSANVKINGEHKGVTPLELNLSVGDYNVEISKQDYVTFRSLVHFTETQSNVDVVLKKSFYKSTSVYFGLNYWPDAISPIAISGLHIHAGAYLGNFNAELDLFPWKNKAESIDGYWAMEASGTNGDSDSEESYYFSYKVDNPIMALKIGYGVVILRRFRITPQVGCLFSNIKSTVDDSNKITGTNEAKKSYVTSVQANLRIEYTPMAHVSMFYAPGYNNIVSMGSIATILNANDVISNNYNGLFHNFGVSVYF